MAPGDEYSAVSGAGKLKLKGLKVKGGRVEKKKKKKEKKEHAETSREASAVAESQQDSGEASAAATAEQEGGDVPIIEKTEAEKKYEEMRRKRVRFYLFFFPFRFVRSFFLFLCYWIFLFFVRV